MPPPNPRAELALTRHPPSTHVVTVRLVSTHGGRRYRLFVAAPMDKPQTGCPALYLLDGNAAFDALPAALLAQFPHLAVIGIGYDVETAFDFEARAFDYTPAARSGSGVPAGHDRPRRAAGGAPQFLQALRDEIIPPLEREFGLDGERRTLWGQSFGGLFALHAMARTSGLFSAYAIASPSLWWDDGSILDEVADSAPRLSGLSIELSRGDSERPSDGSRIDAKTPFERLARLLSAVPAISCTVRIFEGAGHRDVLDLSLPFALRLAAGSNKDDGNNQV